MVGGGGQGSSFPFSPQYGLLVVVGECQTWTETTIGTFNQTLFLLRFCPRIWALSNVHSSLCSLNRLQEPGQNKWVVTRRLYAEWKLLGVKRNGTGLWPSSGSRRQCLIVVMSSEGKQTAFRSLLWGPEVALLAHMCAILRVGVNLYSSWNKGEIPPLASGLHRVLSI
jgi:hypothetical protein